VDYKVIVSPRAAGQLIEITAWIARDNPDRAESFGKELLDRINILKTFPAVGSNFRSSNRFRKLVSEPYLIVYRVNWKCAKWKWSRFVTAAATRARSIWSNDQHAR
jgi:plasmid stabilization system protein ParE